MLYGIQASDDFERTFSQVTDDFLAFIGKALAVLDLIDLRGIRDYLCRILCNILSIFINTLRYGT